MERLMKKKHTKYMYNKHTQRNNINLHAMVCFFTNIYKKCTSITVFKWNRVIDTKTQNICKINTHQFYKNNWITYVKNINI